MRHKRVVTTHTFPPGSPQADIDAITGPRDDFVLERADPDGSYGAADGPVDHYRRTVDVSTDDEGGTEVTETTEFALSLGVWSVLFTPLVARGLARRSPREGTPWWAPPDRLSSEQAGVLARLCGIVMVSGYLGTLSTQTMTFAADEFGASDSAQGDTLAAVRIGVLLALAVVAVADRRGRRNLLLIAAVVGCVLTATGAFAPSLFWLGTSQTFARGMSTAVNLLIGIMAAEAMPRNSRAYAVSVIAMTASLGAGIAVWALPLADLGETAWRILYVIPLLGIPFVLRVGRKLPESKRFAVARERPPAHSHLHRVILLAVTGFLLATFFAPAAQFQNDFLRDDHGFSATLIAIFTVLTVTPGGIGILVGGHYADTRGRRPVAAVALIGGAGLVVLMYLASGWGLWLWAVLSSIVGAAIVPAMGVYRPELFPTSARGRTNGVIEVVAVTGSALGLSVAGRLSDSFGSLGPAIAILAVGPLLVAILVLVAYPETAHHELEDLNPEDRVPA